MRISNYPTDTLTGTELILATDVNTSTQEYKTVNFSVDTLKTFLTTDTDDGTTSIVFEGTTKDGNETTLGVVDPTADITINLPNVAGTLPVLAVASTTAITSTPEELNVLDGYTGSVTELNYLDTLHATGVTSTEFDYLDITTLGTVEASKVVTADTNADVKFSDNDKLTFGGDADFEIYHGGTDTIFRNAKENGAARFYVNDAGTERTAILAGGAGGYVKLYGNGVKRLETTTDGVTIGWPLICEDTVKVTNNLELERSSGDLVFEMDNNATNAANFQIQVGAGNRRTDFVHENDLQGNSVTTKISLKDQKVGILQESPTATLDVNGSVKCDALTTSGDVTLSGTGGSVIWHYSEKDFRFGNNVYLNFGDDPDLKMYHDGTHSYIDSVTSGGDLLIRNTGDDRDIKLQTDDGSGSLADYITLDGSATKITMHQVTEIVKSSGDLKLTIDNNAANSCALDIVSGAGNNRIDFVLPDTAASALLTLKGQKVGIMQTNPTAALDVNGDIKAVERITLTSSTNYIKGDDIIIQNAAGNNYMSMDADGPVIIYDNDSDNTATFLTNSAGAQIVGTATVSALQIGPSPEEIGSGAISLTTGVTYFETGGSGETATLATGSNGLVKMLAMTADGGGDMVVTVTNAGWKSSGTGTITFADDGDGCTLVYAGAKWNCVGNNGCTFA